MKFRNSFKKRMIFSLCHLGFIYFVVSCKPSNSQNGSFSGKSSNRADASASGDSSTTNRSTNSGNEVQTNDKADLELMRNAGLVCERDQATNESLTDTATLLCRLMFKDQSGNLRKINISTAAQSRCNISVKSTDFSPQGSETLSDSPSSVWHWRTKIPKTNIGRQIRVQIEYDPPVVNNSKSTIEQITPTLLMTF